MDKEADSKEEEDTTQLRLVSPKTGDNVASDNPFSPLAARNTEGNDPQKSHRRKASPYFY